MKVLDIGCGNAVVGHEVQQSFGCRLTGTDVLSYRKRDIPFKLMPSPCQLDFADGEFDIGLLVDVLHHIPFDTQHLVIEESLRVCKGVLVFEVAPTWIAKALDIAMNKIHNSEMNLCLTHRNHAGWQELFETRRIPYRFHPVKKLFPGYPFTNYLFALGPAATALAP
jgi:ubiquinone/menaquinone biosynthesis C-methylase UbiE